MCSMAYSTIKFCLNYEMPMEICIQKYLWKLVLFWKFLKNLTAESKYVVPLHCAFSKLSSLRYFFGWVGCSGGEWVWKSIDEFNFFKWKPVWYIDKQWRPRRDYPGCGISWGSALIAKVTRTHSMARHRKSPRSRRNLMVIDPLTPSQGHQFDRRLKFFSVSWSTANSL